MVNASSQPSLEALSTQATIAAAHAYAPYSGFRVGAALLLESGQVVTGGNVESASYGLTICAERSALVRAIAEFGPAIRISAVAVSNLNDAPCPPCGACRQMLSEFVYPETQVAFPGPAGMLVMSFSDVLPLAFNLQQK